MVIAATAVVLTIAVFAGKKPVEIDSLEKLSA
jgi:hypothetical protein